MTGRDYAGPADLPRMQLLHRTCEPEASYDFHVHDLPEEPERNTRLWADTSGELAAMAAVYPPAHLLFLLHPNKAAPTVEAMSPVDTTLFTEWPATAGSSSQNEAGP